MNCDLAHERIVMASYGELPDDQVHELERHMDACEECRTEREQLSALRLLADAYPVQEPDANLVARSRMRLAEALDELPQRSFAARFTQRLKNRFAMLAAMPVATAALLLVGISAGSVAGYQVARAKSAHDVAQFNTKMAPAGAVVSQSEAEISNISSIERAPNSNIVEVRYNQVVPQHIQGSIDDPAIRRLLMVASENASSAGVRDDSVGLLAAECRAGRACQSVGIRDALMVALRYDKNSGVREKALKGLEPFVATDMQVRDAILEALLHDPDARIRSSAISLLQPVEGDTSVRQVLHSVANSDRNPQIRTASRQVLSKVVEIQ